jgi:hypothetical protein
MNESFKKSLSEAYIFDLPLRSRLVTLGFPLQDAHSLSTHLSTPIQLLWDSDRNQDGQIYLLVGFRRQSCHLLVHFQFAAEAFKLIIMDAYQNSLQ